MKRVLLTAFDPFGGAAINPAWEAVSRVKGEWEGFLLKKLLVPTVFGEAGDLANRVAAEWEADAVICVGQAGGRYAITPERVAINLEDASIPDNKGNQPVDQPVSPKGEAAYFSTLPVKRIVAEIQAAGIPAALSDSAGTFVCNHLFYRIMEENALFHPKRLGGFIHVPFLPSQAVKRGNTPSLSLADIVRGLEIALAVTVSALDG